jgi:phosphoribosylformylglycinamidine (FGAM) synthase-like enzyme
MINEPSAISHLPCARPGQAEDTSAKACWTEHFSHGVAKSRFGRFRQSKKLDAEWAGIGAREAAGGAEIGMKQGGQVVIGGNGRMQLGSVWE